MFKVKSIFFQYVLVRLNKCFGMLRQGRLRGRYVYVCPHVYPSALVQYHNSFGTYTRLVRYVYTNVSVRFKCFTEHLRICFGSFALVFQYVFRSLLVS